MRPRLSLGCLLAIGMAAASAAADLPWEVGVYLGAGPQTRGTFQSAYAPSLPNHPEATGDAGQAVRLDARTGGAIAASLTRMLGANLGVELLAAGARSPLGGVSGDYAYSLRYTSRQPPDYQPRPVEATASTSWPATDGELRHVALAANLVFRYEAADRASLTFSGGVAAQRLTGDVSPLGITLFSEGGHAVLFSDTYRVRAALGPATVVGADVGTEFAWQLSPRVALALEVRYFAAPTVRLAASVDRVLNNDAVIRAATPAELDAQAPLQRVELDPSFGAAWAGVRYRF